jgi:hypothetical protein
MTSGLSLAQTKEQIKEEAVPTCRGMIDVEGQEHDPIEVAILAAFLFYRYKFLSQAKDKNIDRLPIRCISKH